MSRKDLWLMIGYVVGVHRSVEDETVIGVRTSKVKHQIAYLCYSRSQKRPDQELASFELGLYDN